VRSVALHRKSSRGVGVHALRGYPRAWAGFEALARTKKVSGVDEVEVERILESSSNDAPLDDHPQLKAYVKCFLETFIVHGRIDPSLRELTILRIAWQCGQAYEWARHYRRAKELGISDDDILSIRTADPQSIESAAVQLAITAADEVVALGAIQPGTFARCSAYFDDPSLTHEFLHLVAGYRMMATVLNTTRPSLASAGLPEWPPDGRGPSLSESAG
jgi:alkylhydroperoxidase family enzyme